MNSGSCHVYVFLIPSFRGPPKYYLIATDNNTSRNSITLTLFFATRWFDKQSVFLIRRKPLSLINYLKTKLLHSYLAELSHQTIYTRLLSARALDKCPQSQNLYCYSLCSLHNCSTHSSNQSFWLTQGNFPGTKTTFLILILLICSDMVRKVHLTRSLDTTTGVFALVQKVSFNQFKW